MREVLAGVPSYDRTSINAWEAEEVRRSGQGNRTPEAGHRRVVDRGLPAHPPLDAISEAFAVVDAVAGTSRGVHDAALRRIQRASTHLVSWLAVTTEIRVGTAPRPPRERSELPSNAASPSEQRWRQGRPHDRVRLTGEYAMPFALLLGD
jgi:hypothetical protein